VLTGETSVSILGRVFFILGNTGTAVLIHGIPGRLGMTYIMRD